MRPIYHLFIVSLLFVLTAGCNAGGIPAGATQPDSPGVADAAAETKPAPTFAPPALTMEEGPLAGIPDFPNILIVAARQSKADLATFLHTTPEQLSRVNPRLPDPVDAGTLVVIPPIYRANGETLSDISTKTGISEDILLSANPNLDPNQLLGEGTILLVPSLYIVPEDTPLSSVVTIVGVQGEALLSANPGLSGDNVLSQGTVLIVPIEATESK